MPKKILLTSIILVMLVVFFFGCSTKSQDISKTVASITADELAEYVKVLSSDEFEGRFPASKGEEKTVQFLKEKFQEIGLMPGNGGSYFQEVPMVEITADPNTALRIKGPKGQSKFAYAEEFVCVTLRVVEETSLSDSDMVFVGYGIVAPEYGWNDYEGLDVKGKTVVMLVNDPGFATKDPNLFKGRAMTYYGRWTYKFEEAARQGAASAFIIHETEPAAYGWEVVRKGWTGTQFNLISEDNNLSRCAVEGWLTLDTSKNILESAGQGLDELEAAAAKRGFKAVQLNLKASLTLKNTIRQLNSRNVIAVLPGKERADEYIFYMAHWDHFGKDPALKGDQIYNGARDNATGTAALIVLANAFKRLKTPPARSLAFLAVTGEEQGLLGSLYYATHPIYPTSKTVAAINTDAMNIFGKMKDITVIGYGNSELDDYVKEMAAEEGRTVRPDPTPEKGSFYRSDHFSFARMGIPAIYPSSGVDSVDHGEEWTLKQMEKFTAEKYHKPSDDYDPAWDLSGAVDDLRLLFKVGYRLSIESTFPSWKEGTEFRAARDADMQKRGTAKKK